MSLIKQLLQLAEDVQDQQSSQTDVQAALPSMDQIDNGSNSGDGTVENDMDDEDDTRQGVIRTIPNAQLVYKRKNGTGSFDELWMYNSDRENLQSELAIRQNILSGTDIPIDDVVSPDGTQVAEVWSVGNVQFLFISGIPN